MHLDKYVSKMSNLWAENRLLKFIVVVLAAGNVFSIFLSLYAMDRQRTVILPPVVDRRIEISGREVNDDYVRMFTRYALGLLLNYSPATFKGQAGELLALASPGLYPSLSKRLNDMADQVKKLQVSSTFDLHSIKINQAESIIKVKGLRKQYTQRTPVEEGRKEYKLRYAIIHGRFYIDSITEVSS